MSGPSKSALRELAFRVGAFDAWRRYRERRQGTAGAYILFGHGVGDAGSFGLDGAALADLLAYLKRRLAVVSLGEAVAQLAQGRGIRRSSVVLTFDDGYANNLHNLLPVLRAYGAPATIFVTSGLIGTRQRVWPSEVRRCVMASTVPVLATSFLPAPVPLESGLDRRRLVDQIVSKMKRTPLQPLQAVRELREALEVPESPCDDAERMLTPAELATLAADPLITIGGHTVSHPILSGLPLDLAKAEIDDSRQQLAAVTGAEPEYFAYPNGTARDFTPELVAHLRDSDWKAAVTTVPGIAVASDDPMQLPRLPIGAGPAHRLSESLLRAAQGGTRLDAHSRPD